jgi:hypothetical protein
MREKISENNIVENQKNEINVNELKKELIEFCSEASTRTRYVFVVLLVASVLTLISIHNSTKGSWMEERLINLEDSILKSEKSKQIFNGEKAIDAWKLASSLKEGKDEISMILRKELIENTKTLLEKYDSHAPPDNILLESLTLDILKLCDMKIFNTTNLQQVILSDETKSHLAKQQSSSNGLTITKINNQSDKINLNVKVKNKKSLANNNVQTQEKEKEVLFEYPDNIVDKTQLNLLILRDLYPKNSVVEKNYYESKLDEKQQMAMFRSYADNKYYVKLPFFGAAFDINDLGLFSGIGLVSILLLLRFSVSREIKNLKYGFKTSKANGFLKDFYYSLAARQIFTVPYMKDESRNLWLVQSPKIIIILPLFSYGYVVFYDWYSVFILGVYEAQKVWTVLIPELPFMIFIIILSLKYYERQRHIDDVWEKNWEEIENEKSAIVWLDDDLVQEFGSDKLTNNALIGYRKLINENDKKSSD